VALSVRDRTVKAPQPLTPIRRRARASDGSIIAPMTLANMRQHGVRSVDAICRSCGHEAVVNVDSLADELPVPDVGLKLKCSQCGGKQIETRPNWREHDAPGMGRR
jgi:hypothetical protein